MGIIKARAIKMVLRFWRTEYAPTRTNPSNSRSRARAFCSQRSKMWGTMKRAKREARRDGVPPIELVDGDKLVDMFEEIPLGLKPIKAFEIDYQFFEKFDYKPDEKPT